MYVNWIFMACRRLGFNEVFGPELMIYRFLWMAGLD